MAGKESVALELFGMGPLELALILGLALVVFGPDKLPELARQIGRLIGEVRRISSEATSELQRSLSVEDSPGVARPRKALSSPDKGEAADTAGSIGSDAPLPPY